MIILNHKIQKYLIFSSLILVNSILIWSFINYQKFWYVYLIFLALTSVYNSLASIYLWCKSSKFEKKLEEISKRYSFVYVIPCYNENKEELNNTINSLENQENVDIHKKMIIVICDGKVKNSGEEKRTDQILVQDIYKDYITESATIERAYKTWDGEWNNITFYFGIKNYIPFILLIKDKNYGKRDSLVLIRRVLYNFKKFKIDSDNFSSFFISSMFLSLSGVFRNYNIDFIIGTDADTVFEKSCSDRLIESVVNEKENVVGCVGFVVVSDEMNKKSFLTLYQNAEYIFAQCLKRRLQSLLTYKVSCLSGCVQIIKICEELCGEKVLSKFNYLPRQDENIFKHILSYASEDRNHICIAFTEHPYILTIQNTYAIAYTKTPDNLSVFLSQRRRWSLGATLNDVLLIIKPNIILIERINAFINVFTFTLFPFILVANAYFILALIFNRDLLLLYLSIPMIIPFIYGLSIPLVIKRTENIKEILYFYLGFAIYSTVGFLLNMLVGLYAIYNLDVIKWGKTRQIKREEKLVIETFV